jgi:hypothetical protein
MDNIVDLGATRSALQDVLGSKYPRYLTVVREWFKGELNKTQFDEISLKLLGSDYIYLHNNMIVGMIEKCYGSYNTASIEDTKSVKTERHFSEIVKTEKDDPKRVLKSRKKSRSGRSVFILSK